MSQSVILVWVRRVDFGFIGLNLSHVSEKFTHMKAVKVDGARRIQLPVLTPGDYYQPEIHGTGAETITLRRMSPPKRQWTKEEALKAIEKSPLRFTKSWDDIKRETR